MNSRTLGGAKQEKQVAGSAARASMLQLRLRTALAPYSVSGKKPYKTADTHAKFLGWQAASLGKGFSSMRTQDIVLLAGLVDGGTWATVLVATPYTVTVSNKDIAASLIDKKCLCNLLFPSVLVRLTGLVFHQRPLRCTSLQHSQTCLMHLQALLVQPR